MIERYILAIVLAMLLIGATLPSADVNQWKELPCAEAVEAIAAVVNERLEE